MYVNADFSQPVVIGPDDYQWVPSPQSGVERVMLDRLGGEKARATSIVRYAPKSIFPQHSHPGGEEIYVLSGTFSEGDRHYSAGSYLRNPPGSFHQPSSHEGAVIFVKLWQMKPDEKQRVHINTQVPSNWQQHGGRDICPLFSDGIETVILQRMQPGESLFTASVSSAEWLLISGQLKTPDQSFEPGTWMRLPAGFYLDITAGSQGAVVYLKTGHLPDMPEEA
ncbi:cupin domain-containing protein [Pseudomonas sp. NPDC089569]|uniref:cupin domain-containing protein n=1 Tax=Pseudomonas sp. NPDC089569 TaxID=3390722 RepID=UPI003CFC5CDC